SGIGSRVMTPCRRWSRWTSATFLRTAPPQPSPPPGAVPDPSRLRALSLRPLRKTGPLGPPRGWFFRLYWPITAYLVTNITVTALWVLFFVLNRTTVVGRKNVGTARN